MLDNFPRRHQIIAAGFDGKSFVEVALDDPDSRMSALVDVEARAVPSRPDKGIGKPAGRIADIEQTLVYGAQYVDTRRDVHEITPGGATIRNPNGDYSSFNPRLGVIYALGDTNEAFASVSRLFEAPTTFRHVSGYLAGAGLTEAVGPPTWPARLGPIPFLPVHSLDRVWLGDAWAVTDVRALDRNGSARRPLVVDLEPVSATAQ